MRSTSYLAITSSGMIFTTLNQSILALKGKKREGKEYSEGLCPSFVRYYPIGFYGRDSDWLIFKTCNSDLTTAPREVYETFSTCCDLSLPETRKEKQFRPLLVIVFLCSSTCFIHIYGFISHTLSVAPDAEVETCRDAVWRLCDH